MFTQAEREMLVFESNNGQCYICGKWLSFSNRQQGQHGAWHVGHKIAKSRGGSDSLRNLVPLCYNCNMGIGTLGVRYFTQKYMEPASISDWVKEAFGITGVRRQLKEEWIY